MKLTKNYLKTLIVECKKELNEKKDIDPQDELAKGTSHSIKTLVYDVIPGTLASLISDLLYRSDINKHFKKWGFNSGFSLGKNIIFERNNYEINKKLFEIINSRM